MQMFDVGLGLVLKLDETVSDRWHRMLELTEHQVDINDEIAY